MIREDLLFPDGFLLVATNRKALTIGGGLSDSVFSSMALEGDQRGKRLFPVANNLPASLQLRAKAVLRERDVYVPVYVTRCLASLVPERTQVPF